MTDTEGRRQGTADGSAGHDGCVSGQGPSLPAALVDEHARRARARSAASRVLARNRARRRIVPPLMVGSGTLLGSGLIGAWVFGQAPPPASAPGTIAAAAARPATSLDQAQLSADVTALAQLRQALAGDEAVIAGLVGPPSAGATGDSAVGGKGTDAAGSTPGGAARSAGTGATPTGGTAAPPGAGGASGTAITPLAALPPLPPLPAITVPSPPPPVHTTTGATVVAP